MGNDHSNEKKFKHGTIVLRTNEPYYFPGSTITGDVYLLLTHPFPGRHLSIKVKGKEKCRFTTEETTGTGENRRTHHVTRTGKTVFFQHKLPLFTFNSEPVMAGQYTFPFCFRLNDILPSTFALELGTTKAKIYYKMEAILEPGHKDCEELSSMTPFIVRPKPLPNSTVFLERDVNLYKFCCISGGHMKLKCTFDKDSYCPGETSVVDVSMDNSHGSIEIEFMQFMLKNSITLTSNCGHHYYINNVIGEVRGNGIHSGESELKQTVRLPFVGKAHLPLQPSTYGSFIRSEYQLVVDTNGAGCGCVYNGSIHHNILMHAELPQNTNFYNYTQPPPDWNPQVMPENNLVLASEYMYPSAKEMENNNNNMAKPQAFY